MMELKRVELANGIHLDVVDEGPTDAPVLIFLHGFPESHRTWRHQIRHFAGRFRCIAPDQRGYRGSSKPQEVEAYTPDKLIGDVFLLADALSIPKFTIVGHDWGGAIAWGVALGGQHMRVERAVIANAPHPAIFQRLLYTNKVQREASQYIRGFRDSANDALVKEHGLTGLLLQEVKWDRPDAMEAEERDALLRDWQNRDAAFGMLNYYRASPIDVPAMDAPFELPEDWTPPDLPKLTIPTLVIWALDDLALPPENLEGLEDMVDPLTIVRVPDCGHFVPWEAPETVNRAMEDFLSA
ncbi:alpha/beta fold hydrolase [Erythrobacter sp. HL-111]|uniref:alpha/beta fold hydrolase n=1 Tax=Erythrobacter sp. HL-111 TaxID=1798193 RepID=UPI0006DB94CA|nr:alpha/beta hydrolase [Erythrobacter sp. HL-111]KPP93395.1 MAG: putative hydrolases or acyltransferases (alpha/beta hydrolase superfamily) [Erythrobacteraceae bacterium HL-111]SDR70763.1 Pimeloyl-ACP methyl ester carboxylesterase [Erythrobacter sp. HL-111]